MTAAIPEIDWPKDPADTEVDYKADWTPYLDGDTISGSVWAIRGPDAILTVDSQSHTDSTATIYVSGGTPGKCYKLENSIVMASSGQVRQRSCIVNVADL